MRSAGCPPMEEDSQEAGAAISREIDGACVVVRLGFKRQQLPNSEEEESSSASKSSFNGTEVGRGKSGTRVATGTTVCVRTSHLPCGRPLINAFPLMGPSFRAHCLFIGLILIENQSATPPRFFSLPRTSCLMLLWPEDTPPPWFGPPTHLRAKGKPAGRCRHQQTSGLHHGAFGGMPSIDRCFHPPADPFVFLFNLMCGRVDRDM
jgi:hypothetical protein